MTAKRNDTRQRIKPSREGFFQGIFKAQLVTGAIGLVGFLVMVSVSLSLARTTTLMTERLEPSVRAADRMLLGVTRSVAALRGWVALGDDHFLAEWEAAWKRDINPAWEQLAAGTALQAQDGLAALLRNLKESQWWVKDVAHTPGNEAARVIQEREIFPLIRSIERDIGAQIQMLKHILI